MSKRICIGKGSSRAFYSYAQGDYFILQKEMIDDIRSTDETIHYYLIADDNKFEGL